MRNMFSEKVKTSSKVEASPLSSCVDLTPKLAEEGDKFGTDIISPVKNDDFMKVFRHFIIYVFVYYYLKSFNSSNKVFNRKKFFNL